MTCAGCYLTLNGSHGQRGSLQREAAHRRGSRSSCAESRAREYCRPPTNIDASSFAFQRCASATGFSVFQVRPPTGLREVLPCITSADCAWSIRHVLRAFGTTLKLPVSQNTSGSLLRFRGDRGNCDQDENLACQCSLPFAKSPFRSFANIAQLVEQRFRKARVAGSSPVVGSSLKRKGRSSRGGLFAFAEHSGAATYNSDVCWLSPRAVNPIA